MEVDAITKGKSKGKDQLFKCAKGNDKYDGNFGNGHWKGGDGGKSGGWTVTPWVPTSSTTFWPNSSYEAEGVQWRLRMGWHPRPQEGGLQETAGRGPIQGWRKEGRSSVYHG